jgi:hypothetical protein
VVPCCNPSILRGRGLGMRRRAAAAPSGALRGTDASRERSCCFFYLGQDLPAFHPVVRIPQAHPPGPDVGTQDQGPAVGRAPHLERGRDRRLRGASSHRLESPPCARAWALHGTAAWRRGAHRTPAHPQQPGTLAMNTLVVRHTLDCVPATRLAALCAQPCIIILSTHHRCWRELGHRSVL